MASNSSANIKIVVVMGDRCKPRHCHLNCKLFCSINRDNTQSRCITVRRSSKRATISEALCIGCTICVQRCPFNAIKIVHFPKHIQYKPIHRYGDNSFVLNSLPIPKQNRIVGIVGNNGIGKSTALKLLTAKLKPNLGQIQAPPSWQDIIAHFNGTELETYFEKVTHIDLSSIMKPQYINHIPSKVKKTITIKKLLKTKDDKKIYKSIARSLDLCSVLKRSVRDLSGGELQRLAIAICCIRDVDVYLFDEISSYIDIKQKLNVCKVIRNLISCAKDCYVMVVDHDVALVEYLCDVIHIMYGTPSVYGTVSMPYGVREGINIYLSGFLPVAKARFRDCALNFRNIGSDIRSRPQKNELLGFGYVRKHTEALLVDIIKIIINWLDDIFDENESKYHRYQGITKTLGSFVLRIERGVFADGEIVVLVGENGTGKTTFLKLLAAKLKSDDGNTWISNLKVSYKPQKICTPFEGTFEELLQHTIGDKYRDSEFINKVIRPLNGQKLYEIHMKQISGGALQTMALIVSLGMNADIYLIDEPSSYLDCEQKIITAKVIKRHIVLANKPAIVAEHDFIVATYLADSVVVFEGEPARHAVARTPQSLLKGMNMFLKNVDISVRRDPVNWRPRINKIGSVADMKQKKCNDYFYLDVND
eukprot:198793_1